MPAEVTARWLEDDRVRTGGVESLDVARAAQSAWVDVLEPDQDTMAKVASVFDLHPLAVEDTLHYPQRPKIDAYDGTLFLIWISPLQAIGDGVRMEEVDAFLTRQALITVHREPCPALDMIAEEAHVYMQRGTDWVLHAVLDRLTDSSFPIVDTVGDRLEELEDEMLEKATREHLEELHRARRLLLQVHRAIGPERDVLRELARARDLISEDAYHYFTDVGDHLARVEDALDTYREVASSAMDIYLSSVSNRMNAIMKQLTVVATIFMPLTLISGIYGMNFHYLPELQWRYGYFGVLASMVGIAAAMLYVFKRRGWW